MCIYIYYIYIYRIHFLQGWICKTSLKIPPPPQSDLPFESLQLMDIMDINTQFDTATQGRTAFSGVSLQQGWINFKQALNNLAKNEIVKTSKSKNNVIFCDSITVPPSWIAKNMTPISVSSACPKKHEIHTKCSWRCCISAMARTSCGSMSRSRKNTYPLIYVYIQHIYIYIICLAYIGLCHLVSCILV